MKKVVIVESPSKSQTINKYLGNAYTVLASFGHVRDLPSKAGSVDPENHFSMLWEFNEKSKVHMDKILKAVRNAETLYLATDPDREGEAISWHVCEILKEHKLLDKVEVKRVVFYEITKKAILEAMKKPRSLDKHLIEAYLARRSLDYLVGFTLSPVLWRKLPGSRSAGRVQSVALRLITDRELEIEAFKIEEYWTIEGRFLTPSRGGEIPARLTHLNHQKLEKFTLSTEELAHRALDQVKAQTYTVTDVQKKKVNRYPAAPFITSTLQQEASRKLGFNARKTMQVAQQLYEGINLAGERTGLITYMRTDSVQVSVEAIQAARVFIPQEFGAAYLPQAPRMYKSKAKNAQEAHEAIRPTDLQRTPKTIEKALDRDQFRLYELIWKRMIASQMENAELSQVTIDSASADHACLFRASGSTLSFDGFLKVYEEGTDTEEKEEEKRLPVVSVGETLTIKHMEASQHFTQPPPRYTEASLVKKLEELGIGRPSTYASIMQTLVDRDYVKRDKKQLVPEARGRVVTEFLVNYFPTYVEFDFTAHLEEQLDDISNGGLDWEKVLDLFWKGLKTAVEETKSLRVSEVLDRLNQTLGKALLGDHEGADLCPQCQEGHLSLKLGRYGAFVGCSQYPTCAYTKQLGMEKESSASEDEDLPRQAVEKVEPKILGQDPATQDVISLRKGPYGFYLQWDPETEKAKEKVPEKGKGKGKGKSEPKPKPKRVAVPRLVDPMTLTLEHALKLGALPRTLGTDPASGDLVTAALGRFGPYVKSGSLFASIGKEGDVLTISLEKALELLEISKTKPKKAPKGEIKSSSPSSKTKVKTKAKAATKTKVKAKTTPRKKKVSNG